MAPVGLGLRANWAQFSLLVLVNAFVGAMAGLERSILPAIAEQEFGIAARTAILSFIVAFGLTKAAANYLAGRLADRLGRKHVLIAGWLIAAPVPFLLMHAPAWRWIVFANVLLGISQGLTWSVTVIMKIDLAGPRSRGLATGLNEFAGYVAVAGSALATAWVATSYGLRPEPFYLGVLFVACGLLLSVLVVRETRDHAAHESRLIGDSAAPSQREVFWRTTLKDRNLSSVSQAGLVNNLNDALAWGLVPLFLVSRGASAAEVGLVAGLYPAVWGLAQIAAGHWSDRIGRKPLIVAGMLLQAAALGLLAASDAALGLAAAAAVVLGLGTALVYPTLIAAISDAVSPVARAPTVGIYRFWRDMGYVAGGLLAGLSADALGYGGAIAIVAALTAASGLWVAVDLPDRHLARGRAASSPAR
jgi:MFS family permease